MTIITNTWQFLIYLSACLQQYLFVATTTTPNLHKSNKTAFSPRMTMVAFVLCLLFLCNTRIVAQTNIDLFSHLPYDQQLSNIWGYSDGNGREYAIVGLYNGTSIVDVTDKNNLQPLFHIDGVESIWREIKTWQHYAYVVSESGGGLQIIDLQYLPDSIKTYEWHGGPWQSDSLSLIKAHTDFVDENGVLYLNGTNLDAVLMCDVSVNPINPPIVGLYSAGYVHDLFVRNDTMWTGEIYNGFFGVVDVSDKANPVIMATQNTPNAFTHNTWLTDNGQYLFTTDEKTGAFVTCYYVSDISDIKETDRYQSSAGSGVIPHNTYVVNKEQTTFVVTSYYRDGVTVVDASNPYNLVETGRYDTSPLSGAGFNGAWGVYPYLPSGALLISDMEEGLFVLNPHYVRAAYVQGSVTNNAGQVLSGATVSIEGYAEHNTITAFDGAFSTGIPDSGTYNVTFYLYGYMPQTLPVVFENGQVTTQNIVLQALTPFGLSVQVTDQDGQSLAGASVGVFNEQYNVNFYATTDNNGIAVFTLIYPTDYEILAGKWGYVTGQLLVSGEQSANPQTITLQHGYYDDFTFDNGWQVSGNALTGQWERTTPHSLSFLGTAVNPDGDLNSDLGKQCYITGGGATISNNVGDGTTILTSPVFDLSSYENPVLSYSRWIYFQDNSGGIAGNDTLYVWIDNGIATVLLEGVYNGNIYESQWRKRDYLVSDYLTPTANMRIVLSVSDKMTSPHIVKAALDMFRVIEGTLPQPLIGVVDASVCVGQPVNLINLTEGDFSQVTWILSGSNTPMSSTNNPTVVYNVPGDYNVSLIISNLIGSNTNNQTAYIHVGLPPSDLQLSDFTNEICAGTSLQVSAVSGSPTDVISWQGNGVADPAWGNTATITPPSAGQYGYSVTADNTYCAISDSFYLYVQNPPAINVLGNTDYCTGQPLNLSIENDASAVLYSWQTPAGEILSNTPDYTYPNLTAADTSLLLVATLGNAIGCTSSDTIAVHVTTPDLSDLTLYLDSQPIDISTQTPMVACSDIGLLSLNAAADSSQIADYEWQGPYIVGNNNGPLLTLDPAGVSSLEPENYTLQITTTEGCVATVAFALFFDLCSYINQPLGERSTLTAYPNPAADYVSITTVGFEAETTMAKLFNSLGQCVMDFDNLPFIISNEKPITFNIEKLPAGIYCLELFNEQHIERVSIVKK